MGRRRTQNSSSRQATIEARIEALLASPDLNPEQRRRLERIRDDVSGLQGIDLDDIIGGGGSLPPGTILTPAGDFLGVDLRPADVTGVVNSVIEQVPLPEVNALDFVTTKVIDTIRVEIPNALPKVPIPEGRKGAALPVTSSALTKLVQMAATRRFGDRKKVIWDDGVNELLLDASKISAVVNDGQVRIEIPVSSDQVRARMRIPFAVGSEERLAGMVMATADRPAGNATIARIWGDALIALAYGALVDAAESLAGASGNDERNDRLIPRSIIARRGQFTVESQARFSIERKVR